MIRDIFFFIYKLCFTEKYIVDANYKQLILQIK